MRLAPRSRAVLLLVAAIVAGQEIARRVVAATLDASAIEAPLRLSETGLYRDGRIGEISPRNRPFSPQYPLWSDGAAKSRWVYIPAGTRIDTSDPVEWEFPVGTRFWKEFTFGGRKIETRLLWRASGERWIFASYAWNAEETDAVLASEDGVPGVAAISPDKQHRIPSVADCRACHESRRVEPLGFNALQLSSDRDPNALHGEPLLDGMVTLQTLERDALFEPRRPEWIAAPPRIPSASPLTRSVLGYLTANCGGCHNRDGEIATLGPSLKHGDVVAAGERVARAMVNHPSSWQVPGLPEGRSVLIDPALADHSAVLTRMRSRRPSSQMPPLGTVIQDREAIETMRRWIAEELSAH